jgi:hypothetical protein
MFCPKCGQRQASEATRFCCTCGTKLSTVEGSLTRRVISMMMFIVLTALAIGGWGPSSMPNYMQIRAIIMLVSLVTFLLLFAGDFKRFFFKIFDQSSDQSREEISLSSSSGASNPVEAAPRQWALPPVRSVPISGFGRTRNTAEVARPLSITEHTTDLLDVD